MTEYSIIKTRSKFTNDEERKQADRDKKKRYYERNKEEIRKKQAEWYKKNREKILEEKKKAYEVYKNYKEGKITVS